MTQKLFKKRAHLELQRLTTKRLQSEIETDQARHELNVKLKELEGIDTKIHQAYNLCYPQKLHEQTTKERKDPSGLQSMLPAKAT